MSDEKIAALADFRRSPLYSEAERLALELAEAMSAASVTVSDELFAALRPRRHARTASDRCAR